MRVALSSRLAFRYAHRSKVLNEHASSFYTHKGAAIRTIEAIEGDDENVDTGDEGSQCEESMVDGANAELNVIDGGDCL
ncbi:hypothetical protein VNO78_17594 [Psophocarpus tetragonolobus]|uniref:Uncharacterized protein n=1 Tax=Psophocarpus tetragonolobus TaxID=3891 RepID=A0AAN9XL52_PSOTE